MKRKVCIISSKIINYIGGVETHGYELAKWLNQSRIYKLSKIITCKKVKDGILVRKLQIKTFDKKIARVLTGNKNIDLKEILKNSPEDTEIYFFNGTNWINCIRELKKNRKNAKIIVRSGGTDLLAGWIGDENNQDSNLYEDRKVVVNIVNRFVDCLIVNSNFSKKRCLSIGISKYKIKIVTGGVDCNRYIPLKRKDKNKVIVLHTSRFVKCKRVENVINTFKNANELCSQRAILWIVGDGPERKKLEKLSQDLNLKNNVFFYGSVNIEKVSDYFNKADIFIHLPITLVRKERGGTFEHIESMGRVFCEAAASGIPSIGTKIGGIPEVVKNNKTGFLLQEGDLQGATDKLVELIRNRKLRIKIGRIARQYAIRSFDWKVIFEKYKQIFNNDR